MYAEILVAAAVGAAVLLAVALAAREARRIRVPIEALCNAAERLSSGDSHARVLPDGPEPLRRLGSTFNEMAERLNVQVQTLAEAQAYLSAVLRQMPEGLLVLDSRGTVARVNAAAERLLQSGAARMVGKPILGVMLDYELDRAVQLALEERRGSLVGARAPGGRELRVAVEPLLIEEALAGVVLMLQDVTELRLADDMRRDFVANVSHELRTPVASIRALTETLMLRRERLPELLDEYGPRIVAECERMERMVDDLLLLARTESGQVRFEPETLDPRQVAGEAVAELEPLLRTSDSRVTLESFAGGPVRADRVALGQCIRNLLDNALRHAPGAPIRIGSLAAGDRVRLYVADRGPGIPQEELPRVFERFYRVDRARTRDRGGSGLGLAIVKHLAELQGGRAWAESRPCEGATFYVELPRAGDGEREARG